jgi:hypothetical protein
VILTDGKLEASEFHVKSMDYTLTMEQNNHSHSHFYSHFCFFENKGVDQEIRMALVGQSFKARNSSSMEIGARNSRRLEISYHATRYACHDTTCRQGTRH